MKMYQHSKKYHNSTLLLVLLLLFICTMITKCNGGGVSMMRKDASNSGRSSSISTSSSNTDTTSILTTHWNSNVCSMDTNVPQFLYDHHSSSNQRLNCCKNHRHHDENDFDGGLMEISKDNTAKSNSKHTIEPNYILVDDTKRHLIRSASKWFTLGFSMFKVFTALYDDKNGDLDNNDVNQD